MLGNLSPDVQLQALEQLKTKPKLVVLDTMNFWMEHFRPALDQVIAKVDVISINDEEARHLTGGILFGQSRRSNSSNGPEICHHQKRRTRCLTVP